MKSIRPWISRNPVLLYYLGAFAISWGGTLIAIGGPSQLLSGEATAAVGAIVIMATVLGPAAAGVMMTAAVNGRAGLGDLASPLLKWRVGARWYAAAVLTAPLSVTAALLGLSLFSSEFLPAYLTTREPVEPGAFEVTGLSILVAAAAAGFFEELGWTGFAKPRMTVQYGVAVTGIVMGILWGLWHLPSNLWGSAHAAGTLPLAIYMAALLFTFLPPYRVLMVWVYAHTQSVLIAMLMHASLVTFWLVSMPQGISGAPQATWYVVWGGVLWGAVVVVAVLSRSRAFSQPPPSR
jgi:membrane protease YdiL (CAAX protease family)